MDRPRGQGQKRLSEECKDKKKYLSSGFCAAVGVGKPTGHLPLSFLYDGLMGLCFIVLVDYRELLAVQNVKTGGISGERDS